MFDMLLLAFQTDSTRVATLLLAHDGSNRSFAEIGIPEGHHDLSHHFDNAEKIQKVAEIDLWYVEAVRQVPRASSRRRRTSDGQSLLHNSMILYGSGNADGNRHTHVNLPIVLAGGGGGRLTPGSLHASTVPSPRRTCFSAWRIGWACQKLERFGDSTGRLANI